MSDIQLIRHTALDPALRLGDDRALVTPTPPLARWAIRATGGGGARVAAAFGFASLPEKLTAAEAGGFAALWISPDEWLILAAEGTALPEGLPITGDDFAIVDASHRQVGLAVSGPQADVVLNSACPLDLALDAFPVNACTRTVFARVPVTLWRKAADSFHVEVWRSQADYAVRVLEMGHLGLG